MRKLFYLMLSIVILGLIISGCIFHVVPPLGQDGSTDIVKEDVSYKTNLIAGQHTVAGFITVSNDDENLFIAYETVDNWLINETHLYIGITIPTNSAPGKFPYKHEELGGVTADTYEIPLDDLGVEPCDIVYIAAHAELVKGETEETGWAEGVEIRLSKNWAMYFEYRLCDGDIGQEFQANQEMITHLLEEIAESGKTPEEYAQEFASLLANESRVSKVEVFENIVNITYASGKVHIIRFTDKEVGDDDYLFGGSALSSTPAQKNNLVEEKDTVISNGLYSPKRETSSTILLEEQTIGVQGFTKAYQPRSTSTQEKLLYNRNILVWSPFGIYAEMLYVDLLLRLTGEGNLGFTIDMIHGSDATMDSLKEITNYGMIFLFTHGDPDGKCIVTGEEITEDNEDHLWDDGIYYSSEKKISNTYPYIEEKPTYFAVSYDWISANVPKNENNKIVIGDACYCGTVDWWNAFFTIGAGDYFAWDGSVNAPCIVNRSGNLMLELKSGVFTTEDVYKPYICNFGGGIWKRFGYPVRFASDTSNQVHNLTKDTYYDTIQAALDDADNNNSIEVSEGIYNENINFNGKNITLLSTNPNDPDVVASTIIDGGENGSVVTFAGGETSQAMLRGLTIQNGNSEPGAGGGIMINNSSPTISGNIIQWNTAHSDHGGGGIFIAHSASPLIEDNTIDGNQAGFGGGIYVGDNSSPTIRNNTLENNSAEIHRGGGIFISGSSSPTIQDNSLSDNSSIYGGGICIVENSSGEISNNYFTLNTAQYGGGIFCGEDSDPIIKQNEFYENNATSFGGGLFIGECVVNNNVISGNTAQTGGGIFVWESSPTISDNTINGNTTTMSGGGIYVRSNSHPTINNNIISLNTTTMDGGGLYIDGSSSVKTTNGSTWPRQNTPPNAEATNTYSENTHGNPLDYTEGADVYMVGAITPPQIIEPPVEFLGCRAATYHASRLRSISSNIVNYDSSSLVQIYSDDLINNKLSKGNITNAIFVWWLSYSNCNGYRVYRSTNSSEYEMILNWDTTGLTSDGFGLYNIYIEIGNTYSYYVTAYNNTENWETVPSNIFTIEIDNETFLPPIYLDQPPDYGSVDDPNYLFQWTPLGDILPYGDIIQGISFIQVFEEDPFSSLWVEIFSDFVTSQANYTGGDLIPGNNYKWKVGTNGLNSNGQIVATSMSQEWEFTYTGTSVGSPTVTTLEVYTITKTAATLWGEIVSTGGLTVTRRGFEYKDSAGGSTFDWHEDGDWSANDYIHRITGLVAGHTYLYRAYAVNDKGTGYGAWESFKTTEEIITSPSVTTVGVDNIQETSIRFKGRIDDTGGEDADWRGFLIEDTVTGWIYSPRQESGPYGTGDYYITYITLSPGRTYKYKACAHNSAGTSYGTEKSVTTQASKQLVSIESSISSVSLKWGQMLMPMDYTITAHYSDGSSADIWHINCTWSSSKPNSVHVNGGIITPLVKTADFAVVTMKYTEGGITKSDTIAVTVLPYP